MKPLFAALFFAPGFFASEPVRTALVIGGGAALVSAVVGVFAVMRGQSFAGHALADVSSAGGAASFLVGLNPLLGFGIMAVAAAFGMELVRVRRARERDLVTGVVLGAGLGLTALFLYFDVTSMSTTGAAITVLFGSMFAIPASIVPPALAVGAVALIASAALYRPLLLCAVDPELAALRGVRVRAVGLAHMVVLALAVALSAMTVGAILSTALLIGPAAIALRLARRPGAALAWAAAIGVGATWGGILLAYDSYAWTPGHGWPVSFFVTTLIFAGYAALSLIAPAGRLGPGASVLPDDAETDGA
ncbi:cation ABC transporter permease [Burkholderia sp. WAC0059]|uniref:metal ABC transporter permease n=1 Tax=Burkholderia sp. WAC0059 TaxID=2066022 RepID=UPI000C7F1627|nr:metal ABC transporter permease [Burkholderia sp. WAC0059]PLZ04049.1 cation ABC transporter permease [Burkholderia sp. WAC0059]